MPYTALLDPLGWKILDQLQRDARLSYSEIGRRVGLSTPAVRERVARMEESGLIAGYHAAVDPALAGYPVSAFIRVTVAGDERTARKLAAGVAGWPEVRECHRCTGDHAFFLKVDAPSIAALEGLIDRLTPYGMTSTSLILSSPQRRSVLLPPDTPQAGTRPSRRRRAG
jgi:Lrp/AsnC family leucine-responsive transcriptional regulator